MMFAVEVTLIFKGLRQINDLTPPPKKKKKIFKGLKANIIFTVVTTSRPKYCRMQSSIFDLAYLDFKSFMNKTTCVTQTKFIIST